MRILSLSSLSTASLLALAACGGPPPAVTPPAVACGEQPLNTRGMPGTPVPAVVLANIFGVHASVNGADGGYLVVDTGAPITLLNASSYPANAVPDGTGTVKTLETLGLAFDEAPVVGGALNLGVPGVEIAGLLGGTLLCHFPASFNYRDAQVTLGPAQDPSAVQSAVTSPFELKGGGRGLLPSGALVEFPNTRISLTVQVEGVDKRFVLDTGASYTVISPQLYADLTRDGRGKLEGLSASTVMGSAQTKVTRARSLSVAGAEVTNVAVADASAGQLLASLSQEVGHPVDGLLGGTYLREFFVTADYTTNTLRLARYATQAHVQDEFRRVGVMLGPARAPSAARYAVAQVLAGTDAAAKGVKVGENILSVDGQPLNGLEAGDADNLLHGDVGAVHQLGFETRTLDVKVDELLALP